MPWGMGLVCVLYGARLLMWMASAQAMQSAKAHDV